MKDTPLLSLLLFTLFGFAFCSSFFWISDIHFDPEYDGAVNSTQYCRRKSTNKRYYVGHLNKINRSEKSAIFGRYGCNPPLQLISSTFQQMRKVDAQPSFILVNGDFVGHYLKDESINIQAIKTVSDELTKSFPNTPVFPCIGNTDLYPDYYISPHNNTFYQSLYKIWAKWIPDAKCKNTFTKGGYYSKILSQQNNSPLKVIVLNSLLYSPKRMPLSKEVDPADQLFWLTEELRESKKLLIPTYIMTHIPPTQNSFDEKELWIEQYQSHYLNIIKNFSTVIVSQFFGHLHKDEFRSGASTIGMINLSISPIFGNNPGFRHMHFNEEYELTNYDQWYLDLFGSNHNGSADWKVLYDFSSLYDVEGFDYKNFCEVVDKIKSDDVYSGRYLAIHNGNYFKDRHKSNCEMAAYNRQEYMDCVSKSSNDGI
ncbi:sphingomyelinase phosphodiesterase D [Acrasis kona]|uniref:Sphingomyelinase phosphodiesterase D n=1 Tax=Acrasis kona TaxID=1008807 RepID=A0AAW2Z8G0_9EUKA